MIGKIQRVPLRQVWAHEALDFTTWLQENIDVLDEILDIGLSSPEREQAAGNFSVDLVAEDASGNVVIIENQLARSDHDHLGKLITYLTAVGARTAVWIVAEPRPEHVAAITWLNESSAASFYLLKIEGIQIDNSPAAPLLTLIVGPSAEAREAGETKKELAQRQIMRKEFWTELLQRAKPKTKLHAAISPGYENWISSGAGKSGLGFGYVIRQHDGNVELYIDTGIEEQNTAIFNKLFAAKEAIEQSFGAGLDWQPLHGRRACRVKSTIPDGGWRDKEKWPEIQEAMIAVMIKLEAALRPYINQLKG